MRQSLNEIGNKIFRYFPVVYSLYLTTTYSYLFFHIIVETLTIIIPSGIFMLVWNARKIIQNNFLIFLSVIYFFVGCLNFFHMISYKGMPVFQELGITVSSQLWIAERILLAASIPFAFLFINRKLNIGALIFIYTFISTFLVLSIITWKIFPVTFIEGSGLTPFKKVSEYLITILFAISIGLLYQYKSKFDKETFNLITTSFILSVISELIFTLYASLSDTFIISAHILVLFSYYFIYKAIIEIGLTKPYRLLFLEMRAIGQQKDELLNITSHEIKNPLTTIKLYSQILNQQLPQSDKSEQSDGQKSLLFE